MFDFFKYILQIKQVFEVIYKKLKLCTDETEFIILLLF